MGRPKGSLNKATIAKRKFVEATTGGGVLVQSKELCLVSSAEIAAAGGIYEATLLKAQRLALDLGIKPALAWKMLSDERVAILPYLEARKAPEPPAKAPDRALVNHATDWAYGATDESEQNQSLSVFDVDALAQDGSHMGDETLAAQGFLPLPPSD